MKKVRVFQHLFLIVALGWTLGCRTPKFDRTSLAVSQRQLGLTSPSQPTPPVFTDEAPIRRNNAVVYAMFGESQFSRDGGKTWSSARIGSVVTEGSIFKTAKNAKADLYLGYNGRIIRLLEKSTLTIQTLKLQNTPIERRVLTEIALSEGGAMVHVLRIGGYSRYFVNTPSGQASLRTGFFSVRASGQITSLLGQALITYLSSPDHKLETVSLSEGHQSILQLYPTPHAEITLTPTDRLHPYFELSSWTELGVPTNLLGPNGERVGTIDIDKNGINHLSIDRVQRHSLERKAR